MHDLISFFVVIILPGITPKEIFSPQNSQNISSIMKKMEQTYLVKIETQIAIYDSSMYIGIKSGLYFQSQEKVSDNSNNGSSIAVSAMMAGGEMMLLNSNEVAYITHSTARRFVSFYSLLLLRHTVK